MAGGVREEPDVLRTPEFTSRDRNVKKGQYWLPPTVRRWADSSHCDRAMVSWGKDTDRRARTPPTSCVSLDKLLSLSVP